MAYAIQLDLFQANDDISIIYRELERTSEDQEKLRRSLFARHGDLMKLYAIQQEEIQQIKHFLLDKHGVSMTNLSPAVPAPKKRAKKNVESTFLKMAV